MSAHLPRGKREPVMDWWGGGWSSRGNNEVSLDGPGLCRDMGKELEVQERLPYSHSRDSCRRLKKEEQTTKAQKSYSGARDAEAPR